MNIANKPWLLQRMSSQQGSFIITTNSKDGEYCTFDILATGTVSVDYTRDGESYHEEYERTPESPALTIAIEIIGDAFDIKLSGAITTITATDYCDVLAVDGAKSLSSLESTSAVDQVTLRKCNKLLSLNFKADIDEVNITDCKNLEAISIWGPESPSPIISISGKTNIDRIAYGGDSSVQEDAMKNGITVLIESSTAETGTVDCTDLSPTATEEFKAELQALVEGYGWTITF